MQKDNIERTGGNTVEAQDQKAYATVKSGLLEHVRISKGLPPDPVQLDVEAVSQLPDAPIIENGEGSEIPGRIVNISSLTPNHSVVALRILQKRIEDQEEKAA